MPFDDPVAPGLAALAGPIAAFRALLRDAVTQGERFFDDQAASRERRQLRAAAELGPFAAAHVVPERFDALFPAARRADAADLAALDRALGTLHALLDQGDAAFIVEVPRGASLGDALRNAMAQLGRGLGAAALVERIRTGPVEGAAAEALLAPMEFPVWSSTARRVAPPLLILLDGADLRAGALAEYTDGREKLVLVPRGRCAPASLVRCITPGTLVVQTSDGRGLERLAAFDGPAIAAIVSDDAATFLHDPDLGGEPWQRLTIWNPGSAPSRVLGGESRWQMEEERKLLLDLARTPFAVPGPRGAAAATGAADAVDRIASWLLAQSEPAET
jgi:hypothetical protein